MKFILVNFLSDKYLESLAKKIYSNNSENFFYLFDHKKPNSNEVLSNINFLDCTYLYDVKNFFKAFQNISLSSFSYEEMKILEEGCAMVLKSLDRITPLPLSHVENEKYFWELALYFKSFILNEKNLSNIVFDNIPHLPWDLTLFYVAKLLNIKTLILRRTNIGGVSFISEDFRPNKLNYKFNYKDNSIDIFKGKKKLNEKIEILKNSEFAKNQIDGIWPEEFEQRVKLQNMIGENLSHYLSIIYSLLKPPKYQSIGAKNNTFLNSTFSRQRNISRIEYFKLRKNYKDNLRNLKKQDDKFSSKLEDISKIKYIFFPLHFQPERSTLPEGLLFDKQYMAIRLLADNINEDIKIIVKDHPKQYYSDLRNHFYRDLDYLKQISMIKNVIVVSRNHDYNTLLKYSKITSTISGSVTWQGLLDGIPGITFSDTWLTECESVLTMFDNNMIKKKINEYLNKNKDDVLNDVTDFIEKNEKYFLDTVVYSKHLRFFKNDKEIPINNLKRYLLQRIL